MAAGLYFNALICFLIAAFAIYTGIFIFRQNKNNLPEISFAAFWFLMGVTWMFVTIDLLAFQLGRPNLNIFINEYFVQFFIFLQITVGSYFIIYRATKNRYFSWAIVVLFSWLTLVGMYYVIQPGNLFVNQNTFINVEYGFSNKVLLIVCIMFATIVSFVLFDFIKNLYYWFKNIDKFEQKYFFSYLAILIYGMVGLFDQLGVFGNWIGVLFRLAIIFCVLITYLAYSEPENT